MPCDPVFGRFRQVFRGEVSQNACRDRPRADHCRKEPEMAHLSVGGQIAPLPCGQVRMQRHGFGGDAILV